uniref:Uncharacterized protein n=1 Tax=Ixodes ricinus TaxID=34613 RepID=A0A6B0UPR8_IXORI
MSCYFGVICDEQILRCRKDKNEQNICICHYHLQLFKLRLQNRKLPNAIITSSSSSWGYKIGNLPMPLSPPALQAGATKSETCQCHYHLQLFKLGLQNRKLAKLLAQKSVNSWYRLFVGKGPD